MKAVLKSLVLLLALAAPSAVHSQCTFCPDGIENPGAEVQGGLITCEEANSFYETAEGNDCLSIQIEVSAVCCPFYISNLGTDNSCGWCPNGVTNPDALFTIPGGTDSRTCVEVLRTVATGFDQIAGICDLATPAAETCCPGDSSGTGYVCQFCTAGLENPDLIIPDADNASCADILGFSGFFNQSVCETNVLPLEAQCCPNSLASASPTTMAPAPTDPPAGPTCEFCPLGIENTGDVLPIDIPGLSGFTCEDLSAGAQFITNATECMDVKQLEGLCCPETTNNYQCPWCTLGIENPDTLFPVIDITCESLGTLVKAASNEEMCSQYQQAQSICCPTSVGAEPCDFCTGPLGVEFPNKAIDDLEGTMTCGDLAIFALGPPNKDFCSILDAAQGLCCPGSTGVSLPPVAEGDYCYICGNAQTEMTKPDVQPFNMLGDAEDPEDLMTCAEIEKAINDERGAGESCASALSAFTFLLSPSICGCAGIEPPDACKFCEGKMVKRDAKLPEESFTCGQGYDFIKHFVSDYLCDAPNTSFDDAQKTCCGEPVLVANLSAASTVTGIFVMLVSLLATLALW